MEVYKTDEERVEAIKAWWEKNGKVVVLGVVIVVSAVVGAKVWTNFKQGEAGRVSAQYDLMLDEMSENKIDAALQRGSAIVEQNASSPYSALAALAMAKIEVEKGDLNSAQLRLRWALDNSDIEEVKHVARLRLARVIVAQDKLDEAINLVSVSERGEFGGEYDFLKGEIYSAKGQIAEARAAYNSALSAEGLSGQLKSIIRLKVDNLGEAKS